MSDDLCPSTVANDVPSPKLSPAKPKDAVNDDEKWVQPSKGIDTLSLSPKKTELSAQDKKRRAVDLKAQQNGNKGKKPAKVQSTGSQAQPVASQIRMESEERPTKVSKHTHKWTYSRIQSAGTTVQQEQAMAPLRTSTTERRASPKSLMSASSAQATTKPKMRARRRRSRGMSAILSFTADSNQSSQAKGTMHASRKADWFISVAFQMN